MANPFQDVVSLRRVAAALAASAVGSTVFGCSFLSTKGTAAPIPLARNVDLDRYMGPWFTAGAIGLSLENGAHNAVETYTRNPDGSIATVFQFRKDRFDGFLETKPTIAWVVSGTNNAEWRVQTIWPLKEQYLISHLEPDYSAVIVARESRDYVWILSREPKMANDRYERYREMIAAMGYDMSQFQRYPQNGSTPEAGSPARIP